MSSFKVVCVNSQAKPSVIPQHLWVEKEEMYTVIRVQKMAKQLGIFGFVLEEISPPKESGYDSYAHYRFRPATEEDFEAIEAVKKLLEEIEVGEFLELV